MPPYATRQMALRASYVRRHTAIAFIEGHAIETQLLILQNGLETVLKCHAGPKWLIRRMESSSSLVCIPPRRDAWE